jgi:hypothetical protein
MIAWFRRHVARLVLWIWPAQRPTGHSRDTAEHWDAEEATESRRHGNAEGSTRWHFRAAILDRLDEYFVCLRRLRRYDPQAYALFGRVGFAIAADAFWSPAAAPPRIDPSVTVGGVLFPSQPSDEEVYPSFVYFRRLINPRCVQRWAGRVYELTLIYDWRFNAARGYAPRGLTQPVRCHIGLDGPDGPVVLKSLEVQTSTIYPSGRRGHRRPEPIRRRTYAWRYPDWLADKPPQWAPNILLMAASTYCETLDRIVIRARKAGMVAAFGIDLKRCVYFFRNRDLIETTPTGQRKRIFHAVRAYTRTSGAQVPYHYRGTRTFQWSGYAVRIVLPSRDARLRLTQRYLEDVSRAERTAWVADTAAAARIAETWDT